MTADGEIERCAQVCDEMERELEALRAKARKTPHDRKSGREVDYAIRAVRRVADRIRALKSVTSREPVQDINQDKGARAVAIIKELRPLIAAMRNSGWRQQTLTQIDELLGPRQERE